MATVERFGLKYRFGHPVETILLINIFLKEQPDKMLTDHLWFQCGKQFSKVNIHDVIEFDARVDKYIKGYKGNRWGRDDLWDAPPVSKDYRLVRPTKIVVVNAQ